MQKWLSDPPPEHLFEITEYALTAANSRRGGSHKREELSERGLVASPSGVNVLKPQLYREALEKAGGAAGKKANSALVIPDYATRMSIIDYEDFPLGEDERNALVRFRLRKSVPFPVDEAQVSYSVQFSSPKQVEVLAVAIAQPILQDYERIFSDAGYRLGVVLPSLVATLPMCETGADGLTLLAKATGYTLSIALLNNQRIRLIRCVDLVSAEEDAAGMLPVRVTPQESVRALSKHLQQTLAYAEDHLKEPVTRVLVSGFEGETQPLADRIVVETGIPAAILRSKYGALTHENAGLLGLMERYAA